MSAIAVTSRNEKLVLFKDYLNRRATGNDPPVSIKAKDLDENFAFTTVIENPDETDDNKSYRVKYEESGTVLEITALPKGERKGDILYWNPEGNGKWVVLPAPEGSTIGIKQFDVCQNGQPKQVNMLVWETD
jgi:hypothetical protein